MVNWQKFEIVYRRDFTDKGSILFEVEDRFSNIHKFEFNNDRVHRLYCVDRYPFSSFKKGDHLEIDLDGVRKYGWSHYFDDTNIIRKIGSTAIVPSSSAVALPSINRNQTLAIGRELDALIDQSGGRNEYEAKISVDPDSGKYSGFSIIGRRNRN